MTLARIMARVSSPLPLRPRTMLGSAMMDVLHPTMAFATMGGRGHRMRGALLDLIAQIVVQGKGGGNTLF